MAIVTPRNPINSFKRLFSVGVRTRTQFSSLWGKVLVAGWGARALSRGSHLEVREQQNDYTKDDTVGNKDIQCACLQIAQEQGDDGVSHDARDDDTDQDRGH